MSDNKFILRRRIAETSHLQLCGFIGHLVSIGVRNSKGDFIISKDDIDALTSIAQTKYSDLPEEWKLLRENLAVEFIDAVYKTPDFDSIPVAKVTEEQFALYEKGWNAFNPASEGSAAEEAFSLDGINWVKLRLTKKRRR